MHAHSASAHSALLSMSICMWLHPCPPRAMACLMIPSLTLAHKIKEGTIRQGMWQHVLPLVRNGGAQETQNTIAAQPSPAQAGVLACPTCRSCQVMPGALHQELDKFLPTHMTAVNGGKPSAADQPLSCRRTAGLIRESISMSSFPPLLQSPPLKHCMHTSVSAHPNLWRVRCVADTDQPLWTHPPHPV